MKKNSYVALNSDNYSLPKPLSGWEKFFFKNKYSAKIQVEIKCPTKCLQLKKCQSSEKFFISPIF